MTLLRPAALAVLVLAAPIVALYVLRLRRPERPISSTLLWRGIVEDMRANAPWQRLRPSLLLAVQILTLAALALALAEPAVSHSQEFAGDAVLILDQSYSMQATDAAPTRFAQAQARARSIASQMAATSAVSVIGMGKQPSLAIAQSTDAGAIGDAIDRLHPGAGSVNVSAALSLAASLARPGQQTQAVVLTDRSSGLKPASLHLPFPVTVIRFGSIRRDLGIVGFSANAGTFAHALVRVENLGARSASSDLNLYGDGRLVDVRPITVAARSTVSLTWDRLPSGIRRLEARLSLHDHMPEDKTAWAVVPEPVQRRVLLVTQSDYYLETALALDPSIALQVVTPAGYSAVSHSPVDVIMFDGVVPPLRPSTSIALIDPPGGSAPGVRIGRELPGGPLTTVSGAPRALTRYAGLAEAHVAETREIRSVAWLRPILRAGGAPAVLVGAHGPDREAVIGFRLDDSDWPLRISFPLFVHALVQYLAPGITLGTTSIASGDALPVFPSPGAGTLLITRPDGTTDTLRAPFPPYTNTTVPGIYAARPQPGGTSAVLVAVNSFPPARSDSPAPSISRPVGGTSASSGRVTVPADVSWIAGLLVLFLLGAEWWVGMRS